ncbi:MAG: hypothetical protein KF902_06605 [Phycisphaeraceae bacterium]|nr:hypothetical protein [Phycisphaeraceae bacterium]
MQALEMHIRLLRQYADLAFTHGNADYYGEVAAKLRILTISKHKNTPLLQYVMSAFGAEPIVLVREWNPCNDRLISLSKYIQTMGFMFFDRGYMDDNQNITHEQNILAWSQQTGAAHEDPHLDHTFATSRRFDSMCSVNGMPHSVRSLHETAELIIRIATDFISHITPQSRSYHDARYQVQRMDEMITGDQSAAPSLRALYHAERARARHVLGKIIDAETDCYRSLKLDPSLADARILLASCKMSRGDYATARAMLSKLRPCRTVHYQLACCLARLGYRADAEHNLRLAFAPDTLSDSWRILDDDAISIDHARQDPDLLHAGIDAQALCADSVS